MSSKLVSTVDHLLDLDVQHRGLLEDLVETNLFGDIFVKNEALSKSLNPELNHIINLRKGLKFVRPFNTLQKGANKIQSFPVVFK